MPIEQIPLILPLLFLGIGVLLVLLLGMKTRTGPRSVSVLLFIALIVLAVAAVSCPPGNKTQNIGNLFQADALTSFFILFSILATAITLVLSSQSKEVVTPRFAEYTALLLGLCSGLILMVAAKDLFLVYLGIEMVSLSSYVLTGYKRSDPESHEAALKYVIFGGVASGVMIFGISLIFGIAGGTSYESVAGAFSSGGAVIAAGPIGGFAMTVALIMLLSGILFKIAAVPFHMWCPDVYQGAPTPFTGFLSVAPKAAGFVLLLRFLFSVFGNSPEQLKWPVLAILGIVSAVTMTLGNLTAIFQMNVKRLLAYSSIAHAGYMMMAAIVLDTHGSGAVVLYLVIYLFMNIGAFAVVQIVADAEGSEDISAFRGLGYRNPLLAVSMGVFLFSLAGIPPLAGFIGKFYLFAALLRTNTFWLVVLAVIGIINSLVALFYYVRIVKEMFLAQPHRKIPVTIAPVNLGIVIALIVPTILLGVYWEPLQYAVKLAVTALVPI